MLPYLSEHWGNPSSIHRSGRRARQGLDEARETVATLIRAKPREIVFTSGGTESDNLAIGGVAWAASARGRHIVTTAIEHKAVLQECALLSRQISRRLLPQDVQQVDMQAGHLEIGRHLPVGEPGVAEIDRHRLGHHGH